MKKTITILLLTLFVAVTYAQRPQGIIMKTDTPPEINGELDEIWDEAIVYDIDKPYRTEVPTLGEPGETTWRMLWDENGIYVFLVVNDDAWYPSYMTGGNNWEYDKPELYFDVNYILEDGLGAQHGQGHHQVAPPAAEATIDGTAVTQDNGVVYAFKVNDPDYTVEYFIPWDLLRDRDGGLFDKSGVMGFDVTIIDRDPGDDGRRRMVWANTGDIDESWSNMDDIGHITFDGADAPTYIESITLVGGEITENGGTLQIEAIIEPEDATNKSLRWSVENVTGRARINNTGLLTAILDGVVTVRAEATDGSWEIAEVDVTISNQIPDMWSLNLIRNPFFEQVTDAGAPAEWGGWIDGGWGEPHTVVDNVAVLVPLQAGEEPWRYQFNQVNLGALPDIPYHFHFKAWSDVNREVNFTFEDTEANGYNRYGASPDEESNGRSDWTWNITMEPTWYEFNVTFDEMVETTVQKVQFMISQALGTVYLDSILLISQADLDLVPVGLPPAVDLSTFTAYPNPASDQLNVVLTEPNQTVAIFNTLGVKVEEVKVAGVHHTFNVSTYPRGMYFVRAENTVVKFIKR